MESNTKHINVVVYGESEQDAISLIEKVTGGTIDGNGISSGTFNDVALKGYIRYPNSVPKSSPQCVTDILIVHLSSNDSINYASVKSYIDNRRGIPFKFLVSESDLNDTAKHFDVDFLDLNTFGSADVNAKIITSALTLEETLKNVFNKIDTNNNGVINKDEIIQVSAELGHPLNDEDAREIIKSLSNTGSLNFAQFKQWWIMGRSDFNSFRKLVEIELTLHKFISKSKATFNTYLEKLQKEGEAVSNAEIGLYGRVQITPETDFEDGISVNAHLTAGNDCTELFQSLPSHLRESPVSFGIQLHLKNADEGKNVIEVLHGVKEMLLGMIPQFKQAVDNGVNISFRHTGESVYIDVTYVGPFADQFFNIISMFDFSTLNFSGGSDFHIASQLSVGDILTDSFDQLHAKLTNLKIEGKGEYSQIKNVFMFIINTLSSISCGNVPKKLKAFIYLLKLASIVRKLDFNFKYDASIVHELIVGLYGTDSNGEERYQIESKRWSEQTQPHINVMYSNISMMAGGFLEQFKPFIQALNLDNISIYACSPIVKLHLKINLIVNGLNNIAATILG